MDQAEPIRRAAELLGRKVSFTDAQGYECEIVGAAISDDDRRVAWVEGRSKQVKDAVDIAYHLNARVAGKDVIRWEVATYNPYFGCEVGYMGWWGDEVLVVYREKHRTLVAAAPLSGGVRLFPIDDEWSLEGNAIHYEGRDPDLTEVLFLPELVRGVPFPKLTTPVRLPLPSDAAAFQRDLHRALFEGSGLQLEKDLILGALGYRYWQAWPMAVGSYAGTSTLGPWNSPCWLPYYWYTMLGEPERKAFLQLLDQVGAMKPPSDLSALSLAWTYIARRSAVLAAVCRAGKLPEGVHCAFWAGWSEKAFAHDLALFPEGLGRAFKQLREHKARWSP